MNKFDNIFLVGPMGAGKSTIGRRLSKRLDRKYFDSDFEIERRTGVKISLIFEIEDEEGFRRRESQVIDELTNQSNIILATGGGVILDSKNRECLVERGFVIYLKAGLEQLLKRTAKDKKRPLLQIENPKIQLERLLQEREPYYQEVADMIIESDRRPVKNIIEDICSQEGIE